MAWLDYNWKYRKPITISGSSGAGTNYQVPLKVGESSGASGYNFHLNGHSANFPSGQNQGGDLRFTASDGTTLLNFWVESVSGTSPNRVAYIWVKVSADLGTNQSIYCYYGNSNATNASSVENTFIRVINGAQPVRGAWPLDEGSGTTTYDKSGNNNNGTLYNGPVWITGKFNNALSFDGTNDYVGVPHASSLAITDKLTVTAWIKPTTFSTYKRYIVSKGMSCSTPNRSWDFEIEKDTGNLFFAFSRDGSEFLSVTSSGSLSLNVWQFVAVVFDNGVISFYINGQNAGTNNTYQGSSIYSNTKDVKIGGGYCPIDDPNVRYFPGNIDEVYIFRKALSSAEISDLYNNYGYATTNYPGRVLVRKYVSPEPAFSSAGAEEKLITAAIGYFSLTGQSVGFSKVFPLMVETGQFVLTGIDSGLKKLSRLVAETGNFVLTGINSGLLKIYKLISTTGQFILMGISTRLRPWGWAQKSRNTTSWAQKSRNTTSWAQKSRNTTSWNYQDRNK